MRRILTLCAAVALVGCAGSEEQATPTLSLDDVAGTWNIAFTAEGSDSVVVNTQINATNTTEGWTITVPDREPMPVHVVLGGDSVVTHAGPFESSLRPGVMVSTASTFRLVDGMMEGLTIARYQTESPDSVVRLWGRGTRAP